MKKIAILSAILLTTIALFSSFSFIKKNKPPNIIIFFADDLGYGDLGVYGHPSIRTPNLDELAMNGVKFTNFYAGSPACTASRYALLTGKYPVRSGFDWVLYPQSKRGIHPKEQTLAEELKYFGYATACFGKWHLGSLKKEFLPLQNGFDEYMGLPYSNDMIPPKWGEIALLDGNDTLEMSPDQTTLTRRYTERAIQFIQKNKKQPFFTYLPYAMPHVPLHPGEDFKGNSSRGIYGDVVEEIDWSVGEILRTLRKENLAENTLIIFTSDNGPWIIKNEKGGSSGLLRDGKGSTWEGGMRVPAIAFWAGKTPKGKVVQTPASVLDIYETCRKLAFRSQSKHYLAPITDGQDIRGLLFEKENKKLNRRLNDVLSGDDKSERAFFYYGPSNRLQAVRKGNWKLHIKTNSQTGKRYFSSDTLLFQLSHDPSEQYDLAEKHPDKVNELMNILEQHQRLVKQQSNFYERK